jgi:hypothetical protein
MFLGVAVWTTIVAHGAAHHSAAAVYVMTQRITIDGVVTKYGFINPYGEDIDFGAVDKLREQRRK